jgi:ribose transport system permease protein
MRAEPSTREKPSSRGVALAVRWAPVILIVLVLALFAALSPRFLTIENLQAILNQSSWLVVVALGANFVLLTGGVDLSAGTTMYLAAVVAGLGFAHAPALLALPAAAIVGLLFGAMNGFLIVSLAVPAFIVTLSTAFIGRGFGLFLSGTRMVFAGEAVSDLGRTQGGRSPLLMTVLGVLLIGWILLRAMPFGRYVFAVGADVNGARRAGVPTGPTLLGVYCISGLFAGVGGFISFSQTSAASAAFGQNAEFLAIAAAVLGGTSLFGGRGTLLAPVLGALLIISVQNGLTLMNANPYAYPLITGGVIFVAALIDSVRARLVERLDRQRRVCADP